MSRLRYGKGRMHSRFHERHNRRQKWISDLKADARLLGISRDTHSKALSLNELLDDGYPTATRSYVGAANAVSEAEGSFNDC
jgi:hypothetical protein